jgi:hypothetical protein
MGPIPNNADAPNNDYDSYGTELYNSSFGEPSEPAPV